MNTLPESPADYLFDRNPSPMWIYDALTLEFLAVNEAAINRYHYSREEFLSMTILDIRPEEEREKAREKALQLVYVPYSDSQYWLHRDKKGNRFHVRIFSFQMVYHGKLARFTQAVDMEDYFRKMEQIEVQNKLLKELAWFQSHGVRAKVANLEGLMYLFENRMVDAAEYKKVLEACKTEIKQLDEIIRYIASRLSEVTATNPPAG